MNANAYILYIYYIYIYIFYEDEDIEQIYEQIENIIGKKKGNTNVIVMGDFNASVGEGNAKKVVGKYGLGKGTTEVKC